MSGHVDPSDDLGRILAPEHTAVVVIDMQNDFCDSQGGVARSGVDISMMEAIVPKIRDLLRRARSYSIPIVFIEGKQTPDGDSVSPAYLTLLRKTMLRKSDSGAMFGIEGTWGAETVSAFERRPDETTVIKRRSSSFVGTDLHRLLQARGIRTVVVVGEQSCGCVEATIRHAADLDYYPIVVRDCIASFDRDLHEAAVLTISRRWWAPTAAEVLRCWEEAIRPGQAPSDRPRASAV